MIPITTWLPPLLAGLLFSSLGVAKFYGRCRGIQGGGGKPWKVRACGSCPSWSRTLNLALVVLCLVVGVGNLAWVGYLLMTGST